MRCLTHSYKARCFQWGHVNSASLVGNKVGKAMLKRPSVIYLERGGPNAGQGSGSWSDAASPASHMPSQIASSSEGPGTRLGANRFCSWANSSGINSVSSSFGAQSMELIAREGGGGGPAGTGGDLTTGRQCKILPSSGRSTSSGGQMMTFA
jgi:hypothetical protein